MGTFCETSASSWVRIGKIIDYIKAEEVARGMVDHPEGNGSRDLTRIWLSKMEIWTEMRETRVMRNTIDFKQEYAEAQASRYLL